MKIIKATIIAIQGLQVAIKKEYAFRLELILFIGLVAFLFLSSIPPAHKAILLLCLTLVLITELINSAIEATVDRISLEKHVLSKEAKDIASAAVFISILLNIVIWPMLLFC